MGSGLEIPHFKGTPRFLNGPKVQTSVLRQRTSAKKCTRSHPPIALARQGVRAEGAGLYNKAPGLHLHQSSPMGQELTEKSRYSSSGLARIPKGKKKKQGPCFNFTAECAIVELDLAHIKF